MAELEIHHESEHAIDPNGQSVGVLAAVLAVCLAIVTIASHRTHTAAIIHKANSNDAWQHYQSTRVKYHNLELGENLLTVIGTQNQAADKMLADYKQQKKKYEKQQDEISAEAQKAQDEAEKDERRALRYDLGEGFLEIGLVLSSLFFISRKKMFPALGVLAGLAGIVLAATGLLVR
jgi:uncharacterized protein DUF4337